MGEAVNGMPCLHSPVSYISILRHTSLRLIAAVGGGTTRASFGFIRPRSSQTSPMVGTALHLRYDPTLVDAVLSAVILEPGSREDP